MSERDEVRRLREREQLLCRRMWQAFGCATNPDDFKESVRDGLWESMIGFATNQANEERKAYDNGRPAGRQDAADRDAATTLCSQCGELLSVMAKIGTTDGWCTSCLDEVDGDGIRSLVRRDTVEARFRALSEDLDEEVAERRANTQTIGVDDRQAFMHYTAGLSEVADRLRAALSGPADEHPADGTGA